MATTYTCARYPELVVKFSSGRVKFSGRSAEVPDHLVERLDEFASSHPDFEIEKGESTESEAPRMTAKQAAKAEAEALGLETSGTTAEIQARIDAHKAGESDEGVDDSDSQESDDQSDDTDEDEAGEPDSSEDDQN